MATQRWGGGGDYQRVALVCGGGHARPGDVTEGSGVFCAHFKRRSKVNRAQGGGTRTWVKQADPLGATGRSLVMRIVTPAVPQKWQGGKLKGLACEIVQRLTVRKERQYQRLIIFAFIVLFIYFYIHLVLQ